MNRNRFCTLLSSSSLLKQKAPSPQQQLQRIQLPSSSIPTNSNINCYHRLSSTSGRHQFHNESRIYVVTPITSQIETTPWNITTTTTTSQQPPPPQLQKRYFSWTGARGYDLTNDTLDDYDKEMGIPKINVSGYDENGFVVKNMIQKVNHSNNNTSSKNNSRPSFVDVQSNSEADSDGSVYMNGSIIVYPTGCFLWNIPKAASITSRSSTSNSIQPKNRYSNNLEESNHIIPIESLVSIVLIRPHIEYVFIGCNERSITNLNEIQYYFRNLHPISIVVEQMQLYNAIGTFNLLNAEDRQVAAALIADSTTTTGST